MPVNTVSPPKVRGRRGRCAGHRPGGHGADGPAARQRSSALLAGEEAERARRPRTARGPGRARTGRRGRRCGRRGRRSPHLHEDLEVAHRAELVEQVGQRARALEVHGWTRALTGAWPSTTRTGSPRGAGASRTVSARVVGPTVPAPTRMTSLSALRAAGAGPRRGARDPLARAVGCGAAVARRDAASLRTTKGRPVRRWTRYGASRSGRPSARHRPRWRPRPTAGEPGPGRPRSGPGPRSPRPRRPTPASMKSAPAHGGVRSRCEQGSRVTQAVAPVTAAPAARRRRGHGLGVRPARERLGGALEGAPVGRLQHAADPGVGRRRRPHGMRPGRGPGSSVRCRRLRSCRLRSARGGAGTTSATHRGRSRTSPLPSGLHRRLRDLTGSAALLAAGRSRGLHRRSGLPPNPARAVQLLPGILMDPERAFGLLLLERAEAASSRSAQPHFLAAGERLPVTITGAHDDRTAVTGKPARRLTTRYPSMPSFCSCTARRATRSRLWTPNTIDTVPNTRRWSETP